MPLFIHQNERNVDDWMNAECEPIHFILNKVFLPLKPTQGHTVFLYPTEVEVWSGLKNILSEMHKALSRNNS